MDEETADAHGSDWKRWTGERGPFYRSCAVVPFDSPTEPAEGDATDIDRPDIEFTTGLPRLMLRNLPVLLLAVIALYLPASAVGAAQKGRLGVSLPPLDIGTVALVVPAVALGGLWAYALYRLLAGVLDGSTVYRSIVFFGTAIPLTIGTGYTLYVALTSDTIPVGFVVQGGFFLFVLVAGHLVYDGLALRMENLLANLGESDIVDEDAYEQFREERLSILSGTVDVGPITVSRSMAFTALLTFVPLAMPILTLNWNVWQTLSFVPYSVVSVFVVAMAYDAFVLIYVFMALLGSDVLVYKPFHPDDHGGFRDLGRFATRVNVILAVTGGYVAYRFAVEGVYYFGTGGFGSTMGLVTWAVSYVVPVLAYAAFVLFWLYHSFWRLHRKMERGRRKRVEKLQRRERATRDDPADEFADLDIDAPAWESLKSAPTWPVNRQSLVGVVVLDSVPILATFVL